MGQTYLNEITKCIANLHNIHVALLKCRIENVLVKVFNSMNIAEYTIQLPTKNWWHVFSCEIFHVSIDAII